MSDNPLCTKVEEQDTMDWNVSDLACPFEEIGPRATISDDSNYDDIQNSTLSKSMAVETKISCSDNQKSECDIISSRNENVRCSEENLDHYDTVLLSDSNNLEHNDATVLSDDNDNDWEDIDESHDTGLLTDENSSKMIDDQNDTAVSDDNDNNGDNNDIVSLSHASRSKNIDDHNDTAVSDNNDSNDDNYGTVSLSHDSSSKNIDDHNDTAVSNNIDSNGDNNGTVSLSHASSSKNNDDHNDTVVSDANDSNGDNNGTVSLSHASNSKNNDDHNDTVVSDANDSNGDNNGTVSLSHASNSKNNDDHNDTVVSDANDSNGDNNGTVSLSHASSSKNNDDHNDTVVSDANDSNGDNNDTVSSSHASSSKNNDDHNDTVVCDAHGSNGNNNDTVSSSHASSSKTNDELSNNRQNELPKDPIISKLNFAQNKVYSYMNLTPIIKDFLPVHSTFEDNVVMYDSDEIVEVVDGKRIAKRCFYLVKWKNWCPGFNTWERFEALYKSQVHIFDFFKKNRHIGPNYDPVNTMHVMLSRQIITQLFETFRTSTGLSLPLTTLDFVSDILNTLDQGSENAQIMRKKFVRSYLSTLSLDFFRQLQCQSLRQWEIDINVISVGHSIKVINNIDLEEPPNSFVYIPECFSKAEIIIPNNPPSGCLCKKTCLSSTDCCNKFSGQVHAYDEHNKLIVFPDGPIFECMKECKCMPNCVNRVVQHGSKVNVCIYKSRFPGWALKTLEDIEKGRLVGIYVGEIITVEEFNQRLQNSTSFIDYAWELDFNNTSNFKYVVDSTHYGNFTRFINHSCEANLSVHTVWIDCLDKYFPQLAFFAKRNIFAGEQLTTDYFVRKGKDSLKKSGIKCHCEMKKCKGYYF